MILLHRKTHRVAEFAKSLYKTNFNSQVFPTLELDFTLKGPFNLSFNEFAYVSIYVSRLFVYFVHVLKLLKSAYLLRKYTVS